MSWARTPAWGPCSQGQTPVIYPGSEQDGAATVGSRVLIAAAGPLWSLLSGMVVLSFPQVSRRRGFLRLLILWFGLLSVQEFAGYLFVGMFGSVGDVAIIYSLLSTPILVKLVILIIGAGMTAALGRLATLRLLEMTDPRGLPAPELRRLGLFAWITGVAMVALLSLPRAHLDASTIFEFVGTLTSGIFVLLVRPFSAKVRADRQVTQFTVPIAGIAALLIAVVARVLVLGGGLQL
jgi:hypothetical protein